jgi:hypothetical protein
MPITPLHFGLLAPVNHLAPGKVSNTSFIIVNLLMDSPSIIYTVLHYGDISHENHTLLNALLMALLVAAFRWRWDWLFGALLGTFSHVLLDSLVHTDVHLFAPWSDAAPFYLGLMEPLSVALLPLTVWWGLQCMSGIRGWFAKRQAAAGTVL